MSHIDVSIIIPVYNQVRHTLQCLEAIRRNTSHIRYEIIVIDNASNDGTPQMLANYCRKEPRLRCLRFNHNLGYSTANNTAAQESHADYLVFLNNDTIPLPGWLTALQTAAIRHGALLAGPKLIYPESFRINHAGYVYGAALKTFYPIYHNFLADSPFTNKSREYQALLGACLLVQRDIFLQTGMFWEYGLEDVDLCLKIRAQGGSVLYVAESEVLHYGSLTLQSAPHASVPSRDCTEFFRRWPRETLRADDQEYYRADGLKVSLQPNGNLSIDQALDPVYESLCQGWLLSQRGEWELAARHFSRAMEQNRTNTAALLAAAEAENALGHIHAAAKLLEHAVSLQPRYLEGHIVLARYLASANRKDEAHATLQQLLNLPDLPFETIEKAHNLIKELF